MARGDTPGRPRPSAEELRRRQEERTEALRLREAIDRELERRGVRDPSGIGAALGLPLLDAERLLRRRHRREGDLALLRAAAARLGLAS